MSEVNLITFSNNYDELDHLLNNVKLMEPNSDNNGGNDNSKLHGSLVLLFATVRSSTDVPHSETWGGATEYGKMGKVLVSDQPLPPTTCAEQGESPANVTTKTAVS